MIWFTSDLHFNHQRIIEYEPTTRPFASVEEMNETLIKNWNSVVQPEDTVYVLGDFIMGLANTVAAILQRLNGTIILIRGNHDTKAKLDFYKSLGITVKDIEYLEYKGRFFILCHFPMSEEFAQMVANNNSEIYILHGHTHQDVSVLLPNIYHVGVDSNNLTPVSIDYILMET